jgi:mannose-1-phosphate guanylyltransferase
VRYLREYQALGTAGGLYLFRDAILKGDPKTIIVMHADVCCSFPLQDMLAMHTEKQAIGTMLGTKVRSIVYSVDKRSPPTQLRILAVL